MVNEEILSTLEGCHNAHRSVERLIYERSKQILELLEVLQDTAISVGEAIEKDYGMRQAAVLRLEEYCELLYQIHVKAEQDDYDLNELKGMMEEADKKIEKSLLLMKRVMGIDISGQFRTFYDRPVYADEVGIFSEKRLKHKTAIVIQGPIKKEKDFTLETVRLYKNLYPDCILILSTWCSEEDYLKPFYDEQITVCVSEPPKHSGALNCSYQALNSYVGIAGAAEMGCERVCKTRTDQRFYLPDLFTYLEDMLDAFPLRIQTIQKERLISISYTTLSNRPYHVCDMFLYGTTEDVLRYFPGLVDDRDWKPIQWTDNIEYSKLRAGEVWFTANYIESLGYELKWTVEDSDYYLRELFLILDTTLLDLYWAKYTDSEHGERLYNDNNFQNQRVVTFFKWLNDYRAHSPVGSE